ncbi:MAG TPA: nuclear transport factor 2 family protein [Longimicrobiaceae bacterium]|nr:nuclear transport factor 2 family protein [Longimicrobiaceae bacterium]
MLRIALLLILLAFPSPAVAQTPEQEVMATVQRLFDGMRAGDSTVVRSVFYPGARLVSVGMREGAPMLREDAIDAFLAAVGTPHDEVWDERIWNTEVRVDGNLATAWMDYAFYLGERFSHCGVNAFQLFRGSDG